MIGFTEFSASRILSLICVYSNYVTLANGTHGVSIPVSTSQNGMYLPSTRYGMTIFYLKTWICPSQSFFDSVTNECVGCSIPYCVDCLNLTYCNACD